MVSTWPVVNFALPSPLIAVVTKTRSPQTTGLEWPSPGIGAFHRMFTDLAASHRVGGLLPSATPDALLPLKDVQFCADAAGAKSRRCAIERKDFINLRRISNT